MIFLKPPPLEPDPDAIIGEQNGHENGSNKGSANGSTNGSVNEITTIILAKCFGRYQFGFANIVTFEYYIQICLYKTKFL